MGSHPHLVVDGGSRHRHLGMLLVGVALALACVLVLAAAAASAATKRIEDRKRENPALASNGRLDIIRASSARFGRDLRFTVTMRSTVRERKGRERPLLLINTRGDGKSDPEYLLYGEGLFRIPPGDGKDPVLIGDAELGSKGRTWSYRFRPRQIPNLDRYGWAAATSHGKASDVAPDDRYVKAQA